MHTVELLEQACDVAEQLGYQTRQEWLGERAVVRANLPAGNGSSSIWH